MSNQNLVVGTVAICLLGYGLYCLCKEDEKKDDTVTMFKKYVKSEKVKELARRAEKLPTKKNKHTIGDWNKADQDFADAEKALTDINRKISKDIDDLNRDMDVHFSSFGDSVNNILGSKISKSKPVDLELVEVKNIGGSDVACFRYVTDFS